MRRFWIAMGFLTMLPVGPRGEIAERDLGGSFLWFPLVGLVIGAGLAGVHQVLSPVFPRLLVGACVLLAWIALTGALHLDGLADVSDGLYGRRTRDERLRIMKDPHVGAMAVVAITGILILKFSLLSSLPSAGMTRALLIAPCLGRYVMVLLGSTLPSARAGEGTAGPFVRGVSIRAFIGATAFSVVISGWLLGSMGLAFFVMALIAALMMRVVFHRAFGGITGDALGASGEVTEVLVLLALAFARS